MINEIKKIKKLICLMENTNINDQIIQRWDSYGFLDGLDNEQKLIVAQNFENGVVWMIENSIDDDFATIAFPIIRKILTHPNNNNDVVDFKYLYDLYLMDDDKIFNDEQKEILQSANVDIEGELCCVLTDYYINNKE